MSLPPLALAFTLALDTEMKDVNNGRIRKHDVLQRLKLKYDRAYRELTLRTHGAPMVPNTREHSIAEGLLAHTWARRHRKQRTIRSTS